jgi:hypothetical protein
MATSSCNNKHLNNFISYEMSGSNDVGPITYDGLAYLFSTLSGGGGGGGLTVVAHDTTLTGDGTDTNKLSVANPFSGVEHDTTLWGDGDAAFPLKVSNSIFEGDLTYSPSTEADVEPIVQIPTGILMVGTTPSTSVYIHDGTVNTVDIAAAGDVEITGDLSVAGGAEIEGTIVAGDWSIKNDATDKSLIISYKRVEVFETALTITPKATTGFDFYFNGDIHTPVKELHLMTEDGTSELPTANTVSALYNHDYPIVANFDLDDSKFTLDDGGNDPSTSHWEYDMDILNAVLDIVCPYSTNSNTLTLTFKYDNTPLATYTFVLA